MASEQQKGSTSPCHQASISEQLLTLSHNSNRLADADTGTRLANVGGHVRLLSSSGKLDLHFGETVVSCLRCV